MMDGEDLQPMPRRRVDTGDMRRRQRFKERGKDLLRGESSPAIVAGESAKSPLPLTAQEAVSVGHGSGHEFIKKTFFQPTFCHHCAELLWGIKGQGFKCTGEGKRRRRRKRGREMSIERERSKSVGSSLHIVCA